MRWCGRRGGVWISCLVGTISLVGSAMLLPETSAGAASLTGTPFKIGYIEQQAGPSGIDLSPVVAAWVKWANANGGINGHPVQLVTETEPGDVAIALTDVQKLISDGIVALFDADSNDAAWAPTVEKAGIPVFLSTDTLTFASNDDGFGVPQSPLVTPDEQMVSAKKVGAPQLALLYCTEFSQCSQAVPFYQSVGKKFGVSIVYNAAVSASAPNYVAQCLAAKSAGATSLFIASTADTTLRIVKDCLREGYTPHLVAGAGSFQKSFQGAPGTNGLIAAEGNVPFFDTSSPAIKTMTEEMNRYNPSIAKSPYYADAAVWNWADATILLEAAKAGKVGAANPVTPAALRKGLFALHSTNAGGLTTTITFNQGKGETNNCFYLAVIKNNKFALPDGLKEDCVSSS